MLDDPLREDVSLQEEDQEFKKEQDRRKKEKRERMIKRNKARRMKREQEEQRVEQEKLEEMMKDEEKLRGLLSVLFSCPLCNSLLTPPSPIYQCRDGHILCQQCRYSEKMKVGEVERSEYESPQLSPSGLSQLFERSCRSKSRDGEDCQTRLPTWTSGWTSGWT